MELEAATIQQIKKGKNGNFVYIEDDVGNVVRDIKALNENFRVRYSEAGDYFVVYYQDPFTGKQGLVTTSQVLDQRLVERIRKVTSAVYDYAAEINRLDAKADKEKQYSIEQNLKENAERLAHALRADKGISKDSTRSKKAWGKGLLGH